ncbi:MAG: hypothetical protein H6861_10305 [Rhodospirillales bacterium]|nr:hypothetical protein [Rhodospirillales bacterium]
MHFQTFCALLILMLSMAVVEYGCGGSAPLALERSKRVVSVDNDERYISLLKKRFLDHSGFSALYRSLGPSGAWGYPVFTFNNAAFRQKANAYISAPWDELDAERQKPDLVLVDGRFRVASILHSLKRANGHDTTFFLHDYEERPFYGVIRPFIDVLEHVDSALIFRRNLNCVPESMANIEQQYVADYR